VTIRLLTLNRLVYRIEPQPANPPAASIVPYRTASTQAAATVVPAPAAAPDTAPGTRERLVAAMLDALQRRGLHGIGLTELLHTAQAPKGVLYHHFPGGKTELAVAAIEAATAWMDASLGRLQQRHVDPVAALRAWLAGAQKQLARSGFESGCPLAAVALESRPEDTAIRAALASAFGQLRGRLAALLAGAGVAAPRAQGLATLIVAAYEGALIQSRVAGQPQSMNDTATALLEMVSREIEHATP
jgi:TetR/AcrR family transcriptional repressor of lmrAB and yxaGH operons